MLRPKRLAMIVALPPARASSRPRPNSTSAPVDGVVVLAPRTLTEGVSDDVLDVDGPGPLELVEPPLLDDVESVMTVVLWVDEVVDDEELVVGVDSVVLELVEIEELVAVDDEVDVVELVDVEHEPPSLSAGASSSVPHV